MNDQAQNPQAQDPPPSHPNPLVAVLSQVAYQQWRHHPVTQMVLRYLFHRAEDYRAAALALWESGELDEQKHRSEELRARVLCLQELQTLDLDSIKNFYELLSLAQQRENGGSTEGADRAKTGQ